MPKNEDQKKPDALPPGPSGSRFSVHANHIDPLTQADPIGTLTQYFGDTCHAEVTGSGAIAQGPGSQASGSRGVVVGGDEKGNIITGDGNTVWGA